MASDEGQQVTADAAAVSVTTSPPSAAVNEEHRLATPALEMRPGWLRKPIAKIEPYRDILDRTCKVLRLPFWLVCAQIAQESDFNILAQSSCGAIGLMQVMPETARSCGVDPEKLWTPETNIRLGCRILADRREVFQKETPEERLKFALAAYNGGLGPVINAQALALRHGFDPSHWQNVRMMLPDTWVYLNGEWKKPDYKQIIDYVDRIWQRYELWQKEPA